MLGKHTIELEFFGFIPIKSTLSVCDRTPPTVTSKTLIAPRGISDIPAEEFVSTASDMTSISYKLRGKIDSENGGTVKLKATDEFGNSTNFTAELIISDEIACQEIELGTKRFDLSFELL